MSAGAQILIWGLAVSIPVILNAFTRRGADALGLSIMLGLIWVLGRVLWAFNTPPQSMALYPVIDFVAGATAISAWATQRAAWKLALAGVFLFQCTLHLAFWLAWPLPGTLLRYLWANNTAFAIELLCVGAPGIAELAHMAVVRLSRGPDRRDHARA